MDAIQTLTLAGLALIGGEGLRRALPALARLNLPAAVLGGLAVALGALFLPAAGISAPTFDGTLKTPCWWRSSPRWFLEQPAATACGWAAGIAVSRRRRGLAAAQGLLGMGIATALGLPPLFGVLTGTATLAGGPATALALAPAFEQAGIHGAEAVGIVAAMGGIVLGGLVGGPVAGAVLRDLKRDGAGTNGSPQAAELLREHSTTTSPTSSHSRAAMQGLLLVLGVMWAGQFASAGFTALGITLPAYVGAMLIAAAVRNLADAAGSSLPLAAIETFGSLALPLFMAMALMTLELGKLAGLATPILVNLLAQTLLVVLVARWLVPRLMGRDYDAAVMAGGFTGFMLGTTANAMAVMRTITDQHGPAPRAFLVAPLVGAFFIDFANAIIITAFLNWH